MRTATEAGLRHQEEPWSEDGRAWLFDYCLLPYPVVPASSALSSRNLLDTALRLMNREAEGSALVDRLRAAFGAHRTVWGVTRNTQCGSFSLELYLYRRPHAAEDLSVQRFAEILAPTTALLSRVHAGLAWHMFSVQLDAAQLTGKRPALATVYSDAVSMSYTLRDDVPELANHYDFHHPQRGIDAILEQLAASVHAPTTPAALVDRLPPQLQRCYHVCVAQKRDADAIYHSRVSTEQLLFFLHKHGWPATFKDLLTDNHAAFRHLLWDIGASYQRGVGQLVWPKSGVYGSF